MPRPMDGDAATVRGRGASTFWIGLDVGKGARTDVPLDWMASRGLFE
jgi:hypothetical protein